VADIDVTGRLPELVVFRNQSHIVIKCEIVDQLKKPAAVDGPALPRQSRGRLGAQPNKAIASQPTPARRDWPNAPTSSGSSCSHLRTAANGAEGRHWADDQGRDRRPHGPNRLEWDRDVLARFLSRFFARRRWPARSRQGRGRGPSRCLAERQDSGIPSPSLRSSADSGVFCA
jgi:hypothetical protein